MGESLNLVNNFKVENVIFNKGEYNYMEKKLIKILTEKNINFYQNVETIYLNSATLYSINNTLYNNENDNSNVIYLEFKNHKFIFMGDAGVEVEKDILGQYNLEDVDVLKVGHHGSKTSTSKSFIDSINPKYSLISVGKDNKFGHPNQKVLKTLNNSKIYRTDQDGSIVFKIKNHKLKVETCAP